MAKLKILLLEDSIPDADLARIRLVRGGLDFEMDRVDASADYIEALERSRYDVILADYALPAFDGLSALEIARRRCPDVPFIFVSGGLGEEVAIDSLKRGATDYVLKQNLNRLAPAVARAIAEAKERTDRRRAEEALRESEARFRQIAEGLPQLVWTTDAEGRYDYLSPQWVAYTGVPEADQLPCGWLEVLHPDDRDRTSARWREAVEGRADYDLEYRVRGADGIYRWFQARGVPLRDHCGRVVKWFGSCTEIDELKCAEEALREADRRKDEFLAMLAHELRNPLAPARNALEIIRLRADDPESVSQAREIAERQVSHMARLIDDLLDVSRITRGKIALRIEPVELASAVSQALDATRPMIRAAGHDLTVELPEAPVRLKADPTRLVQVLTNLLNNAAKYTEPGGRIRLEAGRDGTDVVVRVRDSGIGIAPEMLPRVFDLFAQADGSLVRSRGGLGIGLTLVQRIVQMHGGRIEARSDGPGRGSEFVVRLPALAASPRRPAAPAVAETAAEAGPRRVLVVDDHRDAAESLAKVLTLWGHDVRVAHDGPDALSTVAAAPLDLILLDIGLPGMDGYQVARHLRDSSDAFGPVLVALTGYGQEQDRLRAREAGFDHHLVKPVDLDDLRKLLESA